MATQRVCDLCGMRIGTDDGYLVKYKKSRVHGEIEAVIAPVVDVCDTCFDSLGLTRRPLGISGIARKVKDLDSHDIQSFNA